MGDVCARGEVDEAKSGAKGPTASLVAMRASTLVMWKSRKPTSSFVARVQGGCSHVSFSAYLAAMITATDTVEARSSTWQGETIASGKTRATDVEHHEKTGPPRRRVWSRAVRDRSFLVGNGPPFPDSLSQVLEHGHGCLPVDAGVGDADASSEAAGTFDRHLLATLVEVRLDHDADDASLARPDLLGDGLGHERLIAVVLLGVAWEAGAGQLVGRPRVRSRPRPRLTVRAVDHDQGPLSLNPQLLLGCPDAGGVVIRASAAAPQDDEAVLVAARSRDRGQALLGNAHEVVCRGGGANRVDGDVQAPVGAVLEPDREREPGR